MSLRTKALVIIGVALLAMAGLTDVTSRFTFMRGLDEIEDSDTRGHVEQAQGALSYFISDVGSDYAASASWGAAFGLM